MERKTKIHADNDRQEILITREFEISVELLFKAHTEAEIVEQWMGNRVLKLEAEKHGSYEFEATDPMGNKHRFNGTIHEFVLNEKITRTFEMEGTPFPVQLEFMNFEELTDDTSKLSIHMVFKSVEARDQILKLPFAQGINMAHNRLQDVMKKLN